MHQVKFFIIVLLFSFSLYPMKRDAIAEIEKNWGYKKRKNNCLVQCCLPESDKEYPYFLSEKEDENAKRSFLDELTVMHYLRKEENFPKEITEIILRYSYQLIIKAHQEFASKLKVHDQFAPKLEGWNEWDTFYLSKTQKQTILFLKEHRSFEINGLDKYFAQKMTHNIQHLPPVTKQKLVLEYGKDIICNTQYDATLHNALLGENDNNKECCAEAIEKVVCGCSCCFIPIVLAVVGAEIGNFIMPTLQPADIGFMTWIFSWLGMQVITHGGHKARRNMHNKLMESLHEKHQRLGIQTIPLLQEMECTIIDQ